MVAAKKKRKPFNAKAQSKLYLEKLGYEVGNVEQWIARARRRRDLFGAFDLLAFDGVKTIGVQVTTLTNVSTHRAIMETDPRFIKWCSGPERYGDLHAWIRADGVLRPKHKVRRWRFSPPTTWMEIVDV
jgi:hypothetical protein